MTITTPTPPKRGPGRPPGSKNRPKPTPTGPQTPQGPTIESPEPPPKPTAAQLVAEAATPGSSGGPGRPSNKVKLGESLAEAYEAIGRIIQIPAMFMPGPAGVRCKLIGDSLVANATACGNALAHLADTNPRVKKWLTEGSQFAAAGMVLAVHGPIIAAAFAPLGREPAEPSESDEAAVNLLGNLFTTFVGSMAGEPGADAPEPSGDVNPLAAMLLNLTGQPEG